MAYRQEQGKKFILAGFGRLSIVWRLVFGLLSLVTIGTCSLMLPGMAPGGGGLPFDKALFTAASALSVTGLSTITASTDLTRIGQLVLLFLIQIGGVGYMVLAVTVFQLLGRRLGLTDRIALQDSLGLISPRGIVELVKKVLLVVLGIEALGALALFIAWRDFIVNPWERFFYSVFHAVSSFCNAGFDLFHGRIEGGLPTGPVTLTILGTLIILGGLGIPVLFDLFTYRTSRKLSLHTRLTLPLVGILILWGAVGLFLSEANSGGVLYGLTLDRQLGLSLFQSISTRTAGFAVMPSFGDLGGAAQLMMVTLMFVGCAPASMGGGVTTGTLLVMVLALRGYLRGQDTPRIGGRAIPGNMIRKAGAVLTTSLFAVLTATWLILVTHDTTLDKAVFEVVSAFATSGLTLGLTTELNGFGQGVIIVMMFWGRLGALTLLYAFTKSSSTRLKYPEEKVLIG
ncbi:MAG: hypothetical protein MUC92_08075 [Fimbriimonadaceae bacterium]|jgi:trk system potassium uptake protein TrkH|nr:hypothetical protein [Fimbriimonadaceae bacterium]